MKHIKLIKKICEAFLFFLMGNLIRIAFSEQLNYIDNIFLISQKYFVMSDGRVSFAGKEDFDFER